MKLKYVVATEQSVDGKVFYINQTGEREAGVPGPRKILRVTPVPEEATPYNTIAEATEVLAQLHTGQEEDDPEYRILGRLCAEVEL